MTVTIWPGPSIRFFGVFLLPKMLNGKTLGVDECATTLHSRLKQETSFAHRRVEQAFDLPKAAGDVNTYVLALAMMYGAFSGIRQGLTLIAGKGGKEAERQACVRIERLQDDLRFFGLLAEDSSFPPIVLDDVQEALGCEYVMRGSALGGLVIFNRAATQLKISKTRGGKYFYGDGKATIAIWSAFRERLTRLDAAGECADQIVGGAIKAFCYIERVFSNAADIGLTRTLPGEGGVPGFGVAASVGPNVRFSG
jgi:heme oxygenase